MIYNEPWCNRNTQVCIGGNLVLQRLKLYDLSYFFVFCLRIVVCSNCLFLSSHQKREKQKRRFLTTQKQMVSGLKIKKKTNEGSGRDNIAFCSLFFKTSL